MSDPLIVKSAGKAGAATARTSTGSGGGGSKYQAAQDKVRQRQETPVEMPPEVKGVSAAERRTIEGNLRKKMASAETGAPRDLFRPEMRKIQSGVQDLSRKVAALPKAAAFDPVRSRLAGIEARYKESSRMIGSLTSGDNPRDLLKVQISMYELTQNIEIVSKVVEQVNSGVKQILQTQL